MKQIKKQVLLVLCVVACLFSLTACGKTTDAGSGIDPMTEESLKQQTVTLLEQMVSIPADQMTTIVEQNRKAGSEAVAAGLETYVGLEDDLGAYVSSGEGTVKEIQIFYTKLLTYDNQTIILPNGNLANNTIVNVTAAESRRCDVKVSIAYSAEIKKAKEVLTKVLSEDPDTIKEREHFVFVDELADSGINLCVRCWFKNEDFWQGKWRITEQCKYALDKAEIEIPFPQMDVHMR